MKEGVQDKKAAVLKATLELISEQGFHGTPMSQIAERANIGVGTIYRYFDSKEDLINALYIDIKTRLMRQGFRNYSESLPAREGFKQVMGEVIRYIIEHPAELSFSEQYENSPLITAATREKAMRIAGPANDLFQRAREENLLKELPLEMLLSLIYGSLIALVKLYLSGTVRPNEEIMDAALDAIWDMIKQ